MNITQTFLGKTLAISLLGAVMALGFVASIAGAHADPASCNASGLQQFPSIVSPAGNAYDGSTITYSVIYVNSDPDGAGPVQPCNITLADATIDLPGVGGVVNVLNDATLNVGDSISCPGDAECAAGPYTYVVSHSDESNNSVTAIFDIAGILHQDSDEENASDRDTLSKTVVHPSTITTIESSSATVATGGTVTLTVTEQNNGDVDLTNPSVVVDNGVGTLSAPPTSGDAGDIGVLDVGETWSWTVVSPVINADTTFTATGHGTSNGFDVTWCVNPETPPQGVICDQEEQDSVTVETVTPLIVEKTAVTSYERDWDWTIEKTADDTDLDLQEEESIDVNYTITLTPSSEDINHEVTGMITVTNPAGNPDANITNITDVLNASGAATTLTCGDEDSDTTLPFTLSADEVLTCTYTKTDAMTTDTMNTVNVTTDGTVPGGSDDEVVAWGDPENITDECVTVNDDNLNGPQGVEICEDDADKTIEYSVTFGPDEEGTEVVTSCGEGSHPNTADFITNDNEETGDDTATVNWTVNCIIGCTLTQGYWKTHNDSFKGGAPSDETWDLLGGSAEMTLFTYLGGSDEWFDIFWTAPKGGNLWYQLAHQWMAAKLNVLAGADPAEVTPELDNAEAWLHAHGPSQKLKGKDDAQAKAWASLFGSYNEGSVGPGHCDEQNPS